jgi:zinc protease
MINVVSYPNFTFAETEEEVNRLLNDFEPYITDEAIDRFKSKRRSNIIDGLSSVRGKASQLTSWAYLLDEPYNFSDEITRYENITKEDVLKVYKKYIKNKNSVVIDYLSLPFGSEDSVKSVNPYAHVPFQKDSQYEGLTYNKPQDNFDRSIRPVPGPAKAVNVPVYFERNISSLESNYSIPVIGAESNEVPKVYLLFTLEGGDLLIADDLKKAGLPELTALMLNEGTQNYSTEEISSMLDDLGSSIRFSSSDRTSTVFVTSLVGNLDQTIEILKEKLFSPGFNEEDFKRINKQLRESINNDKKSANNMASEAMAKLLYGKTIRGISASVKGIEKLKLQDVKDFYNKQYNPNLASLVVVGDISQDEVMPQLSFLNNWKGDQITFNKKLPVEDINGKTIYIVHKPGPQSIILLGHHALKYDTEGEYFKARLMNFVFGGAFNSRLNLNLREDKGFTYGIRSGFDGNENDGLFYIQSSVRSEATDSALTEIYLEMENYLSNGISESELEFTKSAIINSDALKYETAFQKSNFLARIQRYGLDRDFTKRQNQIINDITVEEINALAKKHIDKNNHVVVVVGNKYVLKKTLAKFGKVEELKIK